jgi:hypothetical protein
MKNLKEIKIFTGKEISQYGHVKRINISMTRYQ